LQFAAHIGATHIVPMASIRKWAVHTKFVPVGHDSV